MMATKRLPVNINNVFGAEVQHYKFTMGLQILIISEFSLNVYNSQLYI